MKRMMLSILFCFSLLLALPTNIDAKGVLLTPNGFGFGSKQDEDEGVAALIKAGQLEHKTFYDSNHYPITYWIHVPKDDHGLPVKNVPIVLYLHGYSNGGSNTDTAIRHHNALLFQLIKDQDKKERQAIILVPQTPYAINPEGEKDWFKDQWVGIEPDQGEDKWTQWNFPSWSMDEIPRVSNLNAVKELVLATQQQYQSDVNRTYVSGISMGAYATWDLLSRDEEHIFAAAVPICGVGDPSKAKNMKDTPIRMYHGGQDPQVMKQASDLMYEALVDYGNVTYTVYEDEGHPSWNSAYSPVIDDDQNGKSNLEDMIDWMFNQSLQGTLDHKLDVTPLQQVVKRAQQEKKEEYRFHRYQKLMKTCEQAQAFIEQPTTKEDMRTLIHKLRTQMSNKDNTKNIYVFMGIAFLILGGSFLYWKKLWQKK